MLISVIIPTYKPGIYLYECLKSIRDQSLPENLYEVIIILNGCNQPYLSNIREYITDLFDNTENIHVIQTDVPGVSNARNIGIDSAKGDYLTFIDDDDIISTIYLEGLLKVSSPQCIGCSNSFAFENKTDEHKPNFITKAYNWCLNKPYSIFKYRSFLSPPWCKLIHKEIFQSTRFNTNIVKGEDSIFCFGISFRIKELKLASEDVVYFQRIRNNSAMRKRRQISFEAKELCKQEFAYFKLWLKRPFGYNFFFFITRILGPIRNFLIYIK